MNIWIAAGDGDLQSVRQWLEQPSVEVNQKDPHGYTTIHAAVSYGHKQVLDELMKHGGNINIQDNDGDTPLHHVEDVEMASYIIETYNADWRIKNKDGQTPLDKCREDQESPELEQFFEKLEGSQAGGVEFDQSKDLPVRLTYQEEQPDMSQESRNKLRAVVESENPELALRALVQEAVHNQFNDEPFKRPKRDGDAD